MKRETINYESKNLPVDNYLSLQGRYKHLGEKEIGIVQKEVDRSWNELKGKADRETLN